MATAASVLVFGVIPALRHSAPDLAGSLAEAELWPGERAIGKRLTRGTGADAPWFTVVGVAENVRNRTLEWEVEKAIYYPFLFRGAEEVRAPEGAFVTVRAAVPPESLFEAVRGAVWTIDPGMPVAELRSMEQLVARATARTRRPVAPRRSIR